MSNKPLKHSDDFNALCDDAKTRITEISANEVRALLDSNEDFLFLDVRDQNEFDQGHLPKAEFLSKGWIEAKIHKFATSQDQKIVLYCGGGNRSALAADNLQKMGYTNVLSMKGGYKDW